MRLVPLPFVRRIQRRHQFRGRTIFLLIVLMTQMFSPTALVVGLYREFFELNLVNTYLSLILTNTAFNLAFAIWILQGGWISGDVLQAMGKICGVVKTTTEAASLRRGINLLIFSDIGQRTSMRVFLSKMP